MPVRQWFARSPGLACQWQLPSVHWAENNDQTLRSTFDCWDRLEWGPVGAPIYTLFQQEWLAFQKKAKKASGRKSVLVQSKQKLVNRSVGKIVTSIAVQNVHVHACMHVCVYVCMHVFMCVHACKHVWMHACICVSMCVQKCMCKAVMLGPSPHRRVHHLFCHTSQWLPKRDWIKFAVPPQVNLPVASTQELVHTKSACVATTALNKWGAAQQGNYEKTNNPPPLLPPPPH